MTSRPVVRFRKNCASLAKATYEDDNGGMPAGTTRTIVIGAARSCGNLPGWLTGALERCPASAESAHSKVLRSTIARRQEAP